MGFEDGVISDSEPELPLFESSSEEDDLNILNTRMRRRKRRTIRNEHENAKRAKGVANPSRDEVLENRDGRSESDASTIHEVEDTSTSTRNIPPIIRVPIRRPGVNVTENTRTPSPPMMIQETNSSLQLIQAGTGETPSPITEAPMLISDSQSGQEDALSDFGTGRDESPRMRHGSDLETRFDVHQQDRSMERDEQLESCPESPDSLALTNSGQASPKDGAEDITAAAVIPSGHENDNSIHTDPQGGNGTSNSRNSDIFELTISGEENTDLHTGSFEDTLQAPPTSNDQTADNNLRSEMHDDDNPQPTNDNNVNEAEAEESTWSNRRLRPRTQQQLNPYKYDYYQYDRAIRGSGMKPVRLKEFLDSNRAVFAAEDDDLPYEPPEEEESQNQLTMNENIGTTPSSVNRRRRVIIDDDDEDDGTDDNKLRNKRGNRPVKTKKPETILPSLITTANIPRARNRSNLPEENSVANGTKELNGPKVVAKRKLRQMNMDISGEVSDSIELDNDPVDLGSDTDNGVLNVTEDEPDRNLSREDPFNFDEDILNFKRNSDLFHNHNSFQNRVDDDDDHDDGEVIESDWIDPMLSRPSRTRKPLSSGNPSQKKAVNKSIPKLSISTVRKAAGKKASSSTSKSQTHIEQFSRTRKSAKTKSSGSRKTDVQSSLFNPSNEKFLPGEEDGSYAEVSHQQSTRGSGSRHRPASSTRILAELQKARPGFNTAIVEAESGRFAIRRTKSHKPNIRSAVHGFHRADTDLSSKELTPLPGEADHGFVISYSDDDYHSIGVQHKLARHQISEQSSWSTVADIFQPPFNTSGLPSGVTFSSKGLVGSKLLDMVIEEGGVHLLTCPKVYKFGSELGTLDLNETDISVSEKLFHISEVIKGWVKFSLHSPSERRLYRIEQLYDFGMFLLKNILLERLATTEKQKTENIFLELTEFLLEQWENIPLNLRSMDNDFPEYSLVVSVFSLLFEYQKFCHSDLGYSESSLAKCASYVVNNLIYIESESFRTEYRRLQNKTETVIKPRSYFELAYVIMALLNSLPQKKPGVELSFFSVLTKGLEFPPFSLETKAHFNKLWGYTLGYSLIGTLWDFPNQLNRWDLVSSIGKSLISTFSDQEWYVKQMRIFVGRCVYLMNTMKWPNGGNVVRLLYQFYSSPERKFRNIEADGNTSFPEFFDNETLIYFIRPSDSVFHLFLKFTAITILTLKRGDEKDLKTLKSLSGNIRPLGFRKLNRDCRLDTRELEALCNDFSLYLTLYRFCPKACGRPSVPQLRDRLNLKESHIIARKISLKAWHTVMKMTGDNGGLKQVMDWYDDLLEDSLREHEQCQNDVELETHFKNINVKAYEDFLTVTITLLTSVLADTHLLLRIPDWYKIMRPKLMSVLGHRLPFDIKQHILKATTAYISSSEQIITLSGGMEDDSQESALGITNPYASHFSTICLESLHQFVSSSLAINDATDAFYEGLIDCWANAAKFLVRHNQRDWQDFFEGYSKYSWNALLENDQKMKFEPYWMAAVAVDAFTVEMDLFLNSLFLQLVRAKPRGYEYKLFNALRTKDPVSRWFQGNFNEHETTSSQFYHSREKMVRHMLQKMDSQADKRYAKRFLEILRREYREFQRHKRGANSPDFMLLVEDIINDARLYHSDVMGKEWFANNFPEVSDMSIYGYTRRDTSNEVFLACVVSRIDSSIKTGTLETFQKAFALALLPEEHDLETGKDGLLKNYRRLVTDKILPSYIALDNELPQAIFPITVLVKSIAAVYSQITLRGTKISKEVSGLNGLLKKLQRFLTQRSENSTPSALFWSLVSSTFDLTLIVLTQYEGTEASFMSEYYSFAIFLLQKLWIVEGFENSYQVTTDGQAVGTSVKPQVRRSVESFTWNQNDDCLMDEGGNFIKNFVKGYPEELSGAKYRLLTFAIQFLYKGITWDCEECVKQLISLIQLSNDSSKTSILKWLFQTPTPPIPTQDYYNTTVDDIIL